FGTPRGGAFVQRLRELGWIEGRTIAIEYRWSEGRTERYAEIAAEFVRLKVDVIVATGGAIPAAKEATSVIPIVFPVAGDPVGARYVDTLARPGGNITGLSLQQTDVAGKRVELLREAVPGLRRLAIMANVGNPNALREPDIVTYTTYVGQGSPRFWLGLNPVLPNPNFAQIVIATKDLAARERVKARLERAIADGALSEARARVDRFVFGPPVGFPVQFRVVGPDPMKVRAIAEQVRRVMEGNANIVDPHLDWSEQVKSIRLEVDQDRARALGLTPQDLAQTLQTLLSGYTVTQYREGIEHIDLDARAADSERLELNQHPP